MLRVITGALVITLVLFTSSDAQGPPSTVEPKRPDRQDKSPPLNQIRPDQAEILRSPSEKEEREKDNFALPLPKKKRDRGPASPINPTPQAAPQPLQVNPIVNVDGIRQ